MKMYDIIEKKKNKLNLSKEEIDFVIENYTNGNIPDYQMSSLLMAIVLNGMNNEEVYDLTMAMTNSGDKITFKNTLDKHSTGGVGDKTTLVVAPIVASLGCNIAKMSGRSLGYTGGTIDKLESIPGFKVELSEEEFINQVNKIHLSLISQTKNIAPADKKIYALRDVTATVESIPLIASSIMSKKIASGANTLILDVKVGSGAFMKDLREANLLAKTMVDIGKKASINTIALVTNMNQPLGFNIGNALEVKEAIQVLNNEIDNDLKELSIELSTYLVSLYKKITYNEAKKQVIEVLENKEALKKFLQFVECQGGNILEFNNLKANYEYKIYSKKQGYITKLDALNIAKIASKLGAGRLKKEDKIDYLSGVVLNKKINDYVKENELLATLYSNQVIESSLEDLFFEGISYGKRKIKNKSVLDVVK